MEEGKRKDFSKTLPKRDRDANRQGRAVLKLMRKGSTDAHEVREHAYQRYCET